MTENIRFLKILKVDIFDITFIIKMNVKLSELIFHSLIRLHYYSPFFHRIGFTASAMVFLCQI